MRKKVISLRSHDMQLARRRATHSRSTRGRSLWPINTGPQAGMTAQAFATNHAATEEFGCPSGVVLVQQPMKDSVVRAKLLQLLDKRRSEDFLPFGTAENAVAPPQGINNRDWLRALAQLAEYRLIDWRPLGDESGMGRLGGFARINDLGSRVLKYGVSAPIGIALDESSQSREPQLPEITPQQQAVASALEQVIRAIADAGESTEEKAKALSLLWKLLESKAGAAALGAAAQSLVTKYFAD